MIPVPAPPAVPANALPGKNDHGRQRNMQARPMRKSVRWNLAASVCASLAFAALAQPSRGNVIYVTTLNDTIGDPSGCSLKDAIYASRYRASVAISYSILDGQTVVVATQCAPGSGNDTIVLPTGATLTLLPHSPANIELDNDNATGLDGNSDNQVHDNFGGLWSYVASCRLSEQLLLQMRRSPVRHRR